MKFLDNQTLSAECPACHFINDVFFSQVRLNDVVICRGCKANIQLTDYLGEAEKAQRHLIDAIESMSTTINIKIKL